MEQSQSYIEAKKKVDVIKGFYYHLTAYIVVNLALLLMRMPIILFFADKGGKTAEQGFLDWLDWNVLLTPLLWGIGLFIHFIAVFGKKTRFIRNWEERKIREFLKEEDERAGRRYE
jgi:hypothetical protein